ncbi:MAG TPA: hypothetical protein VF177_01510 [Anaerolineae bacterium]
MIETRTTWEDSGYDCDHCGGQIFKRTDYEIGQRKSICYQCRRCGCQWSLAGHLLRRGRRRGCRAEPRRRQRESRQITLPVSPRLLLVLGIVLLLLLVALGGLAAIRFLIPLAIGLFVVLALIRLGREQEWW